MGGKRKKRNYRKAKRKLSEELSNLARAFGERPVYMREVVQVMRGQSTLPLLIFLNVPFMSPIPLPGYSTIIGIILLLLALPIPFRPHGRNHLPKRILDWSLPPRFFSLVLKASGKTFYFFELFLRPRIEFLGKADLFIRINGIIMVICAILLSMPLPIPFSNGFPAWTIMLLSAGMLEYDGISVILGYIVFAATLAFFAIISFGGWEAVSWSIRALFGS